jgi:uncharacterized protein DUF6281
MTGRTDCAHFGTASRRIVYLACLAFLPVACDSGSEHRSQPPRSAPAGCFFAVDWNGTAYYGRSYALPPLGGELGTASAPACTDVLGGEAGASRLVEVRRIAGIVPTLAIAVKGDAAHAYLAAGYFVELPSHPLHVGSAGQPDALAGCATTGPLKLEGVVQRNAPSLVLRVSRRGSLARRYVGSRAVLSIDAHTRIERLSRGGLPFIGIGRRLAVDAVGCRDRGARSTRIVARRIEPGG